MRAKFPQNAKRRIADLSTVDGLQPACSRPSDGSIQTGFYRNGVGWVQFFLAESQSRLYSHMRAKFARNPTAVSKKVSFNFISRLCILCLISVSRGLPIIKILFNL